MPLDVPSTQLCFTFSVTSSSIFSTVRPVGVTLSLVQSAGIYPPDIQITHEVQSSSYIIQYNSA